MSTRTKVTPHISEMLIIKACNTPTGSGGVWRWIEAAKRDVLKNAVKIAPVNNTLNSQHRGGTAGLYKASFRSHGVGSNGHQLRRTVYNVAPYANIVEKGRSGTNFKATAKDWAVLNSGRLPKRFERFSWTLTGGRIISVPGTRGRDGEHTLERAFTMAMASKRRVFISGSVR